MPLKLVGSNDIVLRCPTKLVEGEDWDDVAELAKEMLKVMFKEKGLGLAAPQVGSQLRVAVMWDKTVMVNPRILSYGGAVKKVTEGCLSLPGREFIVERREEIKVSYQDVKGKLQHDHCVGMDAQIIQHEIDHLEGKLLDEHGTEIKKRRA